MPSPPVTANAVQQARHYPFFGHAPCSRNRPARSSRREVGRASFKLAAMGSSARRICGQINRGNCVNVELRQGSNWRSWVEPASSIARAPGKYQRLRIEYSCRTGIRHIDRETAVLLRTTSRVHSMISKSRTARIVDHPPCQVRFAIGQRREPWCPHPARCPGPGSPRRASTCRWLSHHVLQCELHYLPDAHLVDATHYEHSNPVRARSASRPESTLRMPIVRTSSRTDSPGPRRLSAQLPRTRTRTDSTTACVPAAAPD